jgi:hypothetical protein
MFIQIIVDEYTNPSSLIIAIRRRILIRQAKVQIAARLPDISGFPGIPFKSEVNPETL